MRSDTAFNDTDYSKYDADSKNKCIELLKQFYHLGVKENPDKYGADIMYRTKNGTRYCETEYKEFSDIDTILSKGLHISARKEKVYFGSEYAEHITFIDKYRVALLVRNDQIIRSNVITKTCQRNGELYPDSKFIEIASSDINILVSVCGKWLYAYTRKME